MIIRKSAAGTAAKFQRCHAWGLARPLCGVLALTAGAALAQEYSGGGGLGGGLGFGNAAGAASSGGMTTGTLAGIGGLGGGATGGDAGGPSGGRGFYITPTLTATATLTNNVNLSDTNKKSDLILALSPGVQIGGQSGRVRGFLNYALTANFHARSDQSSSFDNSLAASVTAEAIQNWLFIDANASISQQFISPFGNQSPNAGLGNSNRTEVRTVSVSPHVRGQLAGQVNYVGRAFYSLTDSGTSLAADSTVWGGQMGFSSSTRWARLGWGLDFSYREARFKDRRSDYEQLNVASLNYAITPELLVSARGNVETSNLVSIDDETHTGWGAGVRWKPSPRTNVLLDYDRRIFGDSHLYQIDYRTPRTVWAFISREGVSTGQSSGGRGTSTSPFDLLFAQFAQIEPDPVRRAQLVNAFLRANGVDPNASLNTGYLPNQVTLETRNEASMSWLGKRDTVITTIHQTESQSLQPALLNPDDPFAGGNVVRWRGISLNWSHRLTPRSTVSLSAAGRRSSESAGTQQSTLWSGMAMWSNQVAQRVFVSLSARYQTQSGTTSFDEMALLGTLQMTF